MFPPYFGLSKQIFNNILYFSSKILLRYVLLQNIYHKRAINVPGGVAVSHNENHNSSTNQKDLSFLSLCCKLFPNHLEIALYIVFVHYFFLAPIIRQPD